MEKIYHEPNVGDYVRGREILARFPDVERVEVASHWNIPELHGDAGDVGDWAKKGLGSGERALRYERNLKRGLVREFQTLLSEKMPYCKVRYAFWILTHFVGQAGGTPVPSGAPEGFVEHAYQKTFFVGYPVGRAWAWLNDPATFVDGQVWPFRVEFVDGGFEPGVLNVHHGPFLNAAGATGEVRGPGESPAYRDLKYFYGSYAISPRLARPTRLQFWVEEKGGGTAVTLRLDALVRRPFVRAWDLGQRAFWSRFPRWMDAAL